MRELDLRFLSRTQFASKFNKAQRFLCMLCWIVPNLFLTTQQINQFPLLDDGEDITDFIVGGGGVVCFSSCRIRYCQGVRFLLIHLFVGVVLSGLTVP